MRPTKADVDDALAVWDKFGIVEYRDEVRVLAAEVVALREELAANDRLTEPYRRLITKLTAALGDGWYEGGDSRFEKLVGPRYSTETVDALLKCIDDSEYELREGRAYWTIDRAAEAVRASREPKL